MKPVAVTGATGFIGSRLVQRLRNSGVCLRELHGPPANDITDSAALNPLLSGAGVVVHLAGLPSVTDSWTRPQEHIRVHAGGMAALLEASIRCGVQRIVYISSAEVYGRTSDPFVTEDHPLAPRSPYGAAKVCAEKLLEVYARGFGLETVVLRPFSIYGPGASPFSLLNQLISAARSGQTIEVQDLRPVRDFVFLDDVVEAIVRSITAPAAGAVVNIGSMQGTSVGDLARQVVGLAGSCAEIRERRENRRPGDSEILHMVADNRRAASELGWRPSVTLAEGLLRTLRS